MQNTSIAELQELWRRIEDLGFDWISIWDHFYAADGTGNPHCLEAITTHTALAATTDRVRCGSLVYLPAIGTPAVLANAMATLDQVADGRPCSASAAVGSSRSTTSTACPSARGERLRKLARVHPVRAWLLTQERTSFEGEFFTLRDAAGEPKPVQDRLPIWVGGGGEKVTLRICAEFADGWNVPFIAPDVWAHKAKVLDEHCEQVGRDPATLTKSVNVGMAFTEEALKAQFGAMSEYVKPGVLSGGVQEMVDKVGAYVDAGASWVIVAMRAPFDRDGLERFAKRSDALAIRR